MTVAYGHIEAVRKISFKVQAGTVVMLIGPNGAGKSSTLNTLSGVAPLHGGRILLDGQDISRWSVHRRVAAGLIQIPEGRLVLAGMSMRENLELGAYRRPRGDVAADIERMEARFPILHERRNAAAGTLPGGEQQMLAIARGLIGPPQTAAD